MASAIEISCSWLLRIRETPPLVHLPQFADARRDLFLERPQRRGAASIELTTAPRPRRRLSRPATMSRISRSPSRSVMASASATRRARSVSRCSALDRFF